MLDAFIMLIFVCSFLLLLGLFLLFCWLFGITWNNWVVYTKYSVLVKSHLVFINFHTIFMRYRLFFLEAFNWILFDGLLMPLTLFFYLHILAIALNLNMLMMTLIHKLIDLLMGWSLSVRLWLSSQSLAHCLISSIRSFLIILVLIANDFLCLFLFWFLFHRTLLQLGLLIIIIILLLLYRLRHGLYALLKHRWSSACSKRRSESWTHHSRSHRSARSSRTKSRRSSHRSGHSYLWIAIWKLLMRLTSLNLIDLLAMNLIVSDNKLWFYKTHPKIVPCLFKLWSLKLWDKHNH